MATTAVSLSCNEVVDRTAIQAPRRYRTPMTLISPQVHFTETWISELMAYSTMDKGMACTEVVAAAAAAGAVDAERVWHWHCCIGAARMTSLFSQLTTERRPLSNASHRPISHCSREAFLAVAIYRPCQSMLRSARTKPIGLELYGLLGRQAASWRQYRQLRRHIEFYINWRTIDQQRYAAGTGETGTSSRCDR